MKNKREITYSPYGEYSFKEIAVILGITERRAEQIFKTAMRKIAFLIKHNNKSFNQFGENGRGTRTLEKYKERKK